jgi:cobalt-zinc-cadmium efflux system outer membrane protein
MLARLLLNLACAAAAVSASGQSPDALEPVPDAVMRLPIAADSQPPAAAQAITSLAALEALALATHPAIAEAEAAVRAARCRAYQAGLPPNPSVGYVAAEVGNEGNAGQQGVFASQQLIRGNKLGLSRQIHWRESLRREEQLRMVQQQVLARVRTAWYNVLIAQREVQLASDMLQVSQQATTAVTGLLNAGEARRSELLQAEIESQKMAARLLQAQASRDASLRELSAAVGRNSVDTAADDRDLESLAWALDWEATTNRLARESPQLAAAAMEVTRLRAVLQRERAEPIPDINASVSVQYDDTTQNTVTGVQIGMPIPIWNRNQGGIGAAACDLAAAQRQYESLLLELRERLAGAFRDYAAAQASVDAYRTGILDRSHENLQLVRQAFESGEASYLELLTVQRTYFDANLDYLVALRRLNENIQQIESFLVQ